MMTDTTLRFGRAVAILLQDSKIALIERHRPGRHYFVLPGGGIERGESPVQAVVREVQEELGLEVVVQRLVATRRVRGRMEYYFLVEAMGGQFGNGTGPEMNSLADSDEGSYTPVWVPFRELAQHVVYPEQLVTWLAQVGPLDFPERVMRFVE